MSDLRKTNKTEHLNDEDYKKIEESLKNIKYMI